MTKRYVVHPYEPIGDKNSRTLILGSAPSVQSIERGFYYMHPYNRFWHVLGAILQYDLYNATKEEKIACLLKNNIAIYDIVSECEIIGSDDSKIKNVKPSDIPKFIKNTKIDRIFGSGQKAYKELVKHFPQLAHMAKPLPSTSTANAKFTLEMLIDSWQVILPNKKTE